MKRWIVAGLACLAGIAQAGEICTVLADAATGKLVWEQGRCDQRYTPASTFKLPLALMGFDSGILTDGSAPVWTIRPGEPDWGGDNWRKPVDPTSWLAYSVVWYSQRIAQQLGEQKLTAYTTAFGLGNADFRGDPGKHNGLERAWIASSLQVSPLEQIAFLRRLVNGQLPVAPDAIARARAIMPKGGDSDGWRIWGKTGMAYPRKADGSWDEDRGWDWYVGWAEKGGRTLVFARLIQNESASQGTASWRARDSLIAQFPTLAAPR